MLSIGAGEVISTPAARKVSSGNFEPPGFEEPEVSLDRARQAGQNALGQCDRRRNAGRIFVNIKSAVEVRDSQAFQIQLRVKHNARPEISVEQLAIFAFEDIQGERIAPFLDRVNDFLELGEHRLAKKCAANVVDLAIDDVGPHLRIARLLEEMMSKELFVKGRGHLR